jgi:hypothetical protein
MVEINLLKGQKRSTRTREEHKRGQKSERRAGCVAGLPSLGEASCQQSSSRGGIKFARGMDGQFTCR